MIVKNIISFVSIRDLRPYKTCFKSQAWQRTNFYSARLEKVSAYHFFFWVQEIQHKTWFILRTRLK